MRPVAELCAAIAAVAFIWSGVAKTLRPTRAARAFVELGVVNRAPVGLAIALAFAEIGCGIGLLVPQRVISGLAATGALVLFIGFSVLTGRHVLAGSRVKCFCFGHEDEEVTWLSFARALLLATLTVIVLGFTASRSLWPNAHAVVIGATAALGAVAVAALSGSLHSIATSGLRVNEVLSPEAEFSPLAGAVQP